MPITRPFTVEEDITMSMSTTVTGIIAKYNSTGQVQAKPIFVSLVGNLCLGLNEMIEGSNMTFTERAALRGELKALAAKAFRAKLNIVNGLTGESIDRQEGEKDN